MKEAIDVFFVKYHNDGSYEFGLIEAYNHLPIEYIEELLETINEYFKTILKEWSGKDESSNNY